MWRKDGEVRKMRLIDADAFDDILADGEIKARKSRKYVLESAINTIRGNLAQMPSAQPEQSEIIRCKDCKRWNTVINRKKAEYGLCQIQTQLRAFKRDDWCSRAERITDEVN